MIDTDLDVARRLRREEGTAKVEAR